MEMSFAGIIGLVLGIAFSYYDKKSGSKLYKKWYNISNKNNIDPNLEIGFVSNQLFGQKLSVALILTAFAYVISFVVFGVNAIHALFYMIPFIIGLMIAFYTSSLILGIFSKKANKVIDYIEEVEKGGIDLKEITENFEFKNLPNHHAIGEMLDWDAPTGGYLLQGCMSMGFALAKKFNSTN